MLSVLILSLKKKTQFNGSQRKENKSAISLVQTHTHTHTLTQVHTYIYERYICIYIYYAEIYIVYNLQENKYIQSAWGVQYNNIKNKPKIII